MAHSRNKATVGFTIVELLIVIVVIGILAAIVIVAYTGVQNKANDASVQSDLRNIGGQISQFQSLNDHLPSPVGELATMGLKVSKNAYGAHYTPAPGNENNLIYCYSSLTAPSASFILVAASKSGTVYTYQGGVKVGVGPLVTFTTTCANNGLSSTGSWFYAGGAWQPYITAQ